MPQTDSTILIGYDGSEHAAAAIRVAGGLFGPRRAIVAFVWDSLAGLLLNTDIDTMYEPLREPARLIEEEDRADAAAVATQGAKLATEAGFDAVAVVARGKPKAWPTVLALADEHEAAAIVVGSRGLGGVKSALFGSVSSGVLDHAHRPVMVIPPLGDNPPSGPLLAGYDGSEQAGAAIEAAGELMCVREMLVATVWLSCLETAAAGVAGLPAGVAVKGAQALDAELRASARRTAERGAQLAAAQQLEARSEALKGDSNVWSTLLHTAEDRRASAIVLGSRGRSAFAANVLGSVSRAIVHHAPAPVLVMRPPR